MPTISFSKNEKKAVKGAAKVGAAVGGAIAGAVVGAARGGARQQPPPQVVVAQPAQPMGFNHFGQPVYAQQPPIVVVQRPGMRQNLGPGNILGVAVGVASVAEHAFGGTEYPPRDACLCCGTGCCYTAVTSRNWARCHNHITCCCIETQSCCCANVQMRNECCIDHIGCKAPTFECCNCGM